MVEAVPPGRRWFQFGLRTMFVVVTLVAAFLAYQLNWIRKRHRFLVFVDRNDHTQVLGEWINPKRPRNSKAPRAPWLLWLIGEPCQSQILVSIDNPDPAGAFSDYAVQRNRPWRTPKYCSRSSDICPAKPRARCRIGPASLS